MLADVAVDALEDFRQTRKISLVTWKVELQTLVTFFAYCVRRKWIQTNPARELKSPRNFEAERSSTLHVEGRDPNPSGLRTNRWRQVQPERRAV